MKKKALIATCAAVALVAAVGIGSTLAYFTDSASEMNTVTFGHVDITLDEPNFDTEDGEQDNAIFHVTPNQEITKDPTITALAGSEAMYLRVKIEVGGGLTDMPMMEDMRAEDAEIVNPYIADLLANLDIDSDLWVYSDGYYYYQNVVEKKDVDQKIPVFTTVKIPEYWGNDVADKDFTINVTAEAIQADNFTPTQNNGQIVGWKTSDGAEITAETYGEGVAQD